MFREVFYLQVIILVKTPVNKLPEQKVTPVEIPDEISACLANTAVVTTLIDRHLSYAKLKMVVARIFSVTKNCQIHVFVVKKGGVS